LLYQENRSFDSYFGTFPGAENLASPLARSHGFTQADPIGNALVTPFRLPDPDIGQVDHSRPALYARVNGGLMDRFVADEETRSLQKPLPRPVARQFGLLAMAYQDCDTIPFYWKYANTFVLYDHMFQGMYGPSTPGNLDIVSAQTGQSQATRHPNEVVAPTDSGAGVPVYVDLVPAFGPYHGGAATAKQIDLTFANVLLTLSGTAAARATNDTDDVKDDIAALARDGKPEVPWGWYQEGFRDDGSGKYPAYVTHHNAPQFFGYIRQNAALWSHVHDLTELFGAVSNATLPDRSVVIVKGGYKNPFGWVPANRDPKVRSAFLGDDDHPGYSDSQLSESLVARVVNAVARSRYWKDSAIVIAWDDSEGSYDHVPPPQFEPCTDGRACGDGPRVPFILVSPYARSHAIASDPGDHASFPKFLEAVFDLIPLSSLPNEHATLPEGPRDGNPAISDLLSGFDPERLTGTKAPIAANDAIISDDVVNAFPPRMSCASLGITPVTVPNALENAPQGFVPRPGP
ncbi:MAG: phosphoesterase, partial [Candidatus Eremiobacteraeota bacterium]|nr:phosphoesterase [Candidatus Eremiobacteraeota bacterium]